MRKYIVQPGDTLYFIAGKFGISLGQLLSANPQVNNPYLIMPGQIVNIPLVVHSNPVTPPLKATLPGGCIVFASNQREKTELWLAAATGNQKSRLGGKPGTPQQISDSPKPEWSPDGKYIAYLAKAEKKYP